MGEQATNPMEAIKMRCPSGKEVSFLEWVNTQTNESLSNDIKQMLIIVNKEVARLLSVNDNAKAQAVREAVVSTYLTLLILVADTRTPIPVNDEV